VPRGPSDLIGCQSKRRGEGKHRGNDIITTERKATQRKAEKELRTAGEKQGNKGVCPWL
jgi:hypothetical protein